MKLPLRTYLPTDQGGFIIILGYENLAKLKVCVCVYIYIYTYTYLQLGQVLVTKDDDDKSSLIRRQVCRGNFTLLRNSACASALLARFLIESVHASFMPAPPYEILLKLSTLAAGLSALFIGRIRPRPM